MATSLPLDYGQRLTDKNIRVLKFAECLATHNQCVHLEIVPAELPDENTRHPLKVPFVALFYVWAQASSGNQNPHIIINGTEFKVAPNLNCALLHLETNIDLPIWIDAICINQTDLIERSEQVLQMRDIYAAASRTVI